MIDLITRTTKRTFFEAKRLIANKEQTVKSRPQRERPKDEIKIYSQDMVARQAIRFWETEKAVNYMTAERGFTEETLRYFEVGYNVKTWPEYIELVSVPMHLVDGRCCGFIGRPPDKADKRFRNSPKLPSRESLWNIHRARRAGGKVIICESSFDAMRIHQAGYPNVVATLGGYFREQRIEQIGRNFSEVIIMTDFDRKEDHIDKMCRTHGTQCLGHNPGRDLGFRIAEGCSSKKIRWAMYSDKEVYPHGAKDAGDMSDDEIRACLVNAVSNFEYMQLRNVMPDVVY